MQYNKENIKYMRRALKLAAKGKLAHPNPMVGCVVVKDSKIIGEGCHEYFGGPHAEANALIMSAKQAYGADLYVTLEPCSHYGKQPPCTQAIIKAGIKRVFIATPDGSQEGIKTLKAAGVEVFSGLLSSQAKSLNKEFFSPKKPHIAVKFAMSLDGKIATKNYDSKWITSAKSRNFARKIRASFDAILVGRSTLIKDNPALTTHAKGKNPVRIFLDKNLKTPPHYQAFDGKAVSIFAYNSGLKKVPPHFKAKNIMLLPLDFEALKKDFSLLLNALNKMGLKRILIEGGGQTIASVLATGKVSEVFAFIAPLIIGGKAAITPVEGLGAATVKEAFKLKKIEVKKIAQDIFVRGVL
ncbi:MAG: bifunctional diaminohydroxyphosphoribosylaminopyrimidine deaminase/5-amino-6-(5-phosphoribosylamino)uracil reductase RibD [Elusimicrobiota bacterium]|jgi:diaminohydroxyphosphoribosylaminopyrimidine deaminase/5-amino-6-(5-phosphoribosylamino)uracil reductase|nr:bifunctional diaminohydroxyphosphoribosylaminopyrimidine deaminase/5-amino-6-(5-phosphoribosylamino)uracil reductase RibD [Elusimicrobiota bacterium]